MVRVKLRGFKAIDRRTVGAREAMAFRSELIAALGGEPALSPQRRRRIDMAARAALLLDHVDGWLVGQRSLVNSRTRSLLPVLVQRQSLAEHLAKLLDRLGLDRVPGKVVSLPDYLAERYGATATPSANVDSSRQEIRGDRSTIGRPADTASEHGP
jgi:hypothetical protein